MAVKKYVVCDVCKGILRKDPESDKFINGRRIHIKLFQNIDICDSCLAALIQLKQDIKLEDKLINKCIDTVLSDPDNRFDNAEYEAGYFDGYQSACEHILLHNRMHRIRSNKIKSNRNMEDMN